MSWYVHRALFACFLFPFFCHSLDDIIDHYKKEQIVEGYNLKEPVSVQVSSRTDCNSHVIRKRLVAVSYW